MKTKSFILLLFFSLTKLAFSQFENEEDNQYKWSISASINSVEAQMDQKLLDTWVFPSANYYAYFGDKQDNSLSLSVIPKYMIADDLLLRFEFGMTNIDLRMHYNGGGDTLTQNQGHIGSTADIIKEDIIQQKIYRYAAGLQWSFLNKKFIETYCGASLNYFHYSEMHWSDYINDITTLSPNYNYSQYTATTPGGFATGVGAFAGLNIYLHNRVSIGGEFSYSLLYYKLGGMQKGVYERHNSVWGSTYVYEHWQIYNNASKGIQFSKIMPSLNLTIRF